MQCILLADTPEGIAVLRPMLAAYRVIEAATLAVAKKALVGEIDLVICGTLFDECQMFELLRHLQTDLSREPVPFVCVRTEPGKLCDELYESVKISATVLGAAAYIDVWRWQAQHGDRAAGARLAAKLVELLGATSAH